MHHKSAVKGESMYATKHKAFAMILAIFVVLLVASGGVLLLRNAATGTKSVGDNYLRAQAELLAESATEYGVMRAQGDTLVAAGQCLNQLLITIKDTNNIPMFDANVTMSYSYREAAPTATSTPGTCTFLAQNTGKDSMILVDTIISDHNLSTEPIRIHKRTWQKL